MKCPFLQEAQVKFCRASVFRKMIVRTPDQATRERCSTPDYVHCPAAAKPHEKLSDQSHCPFLQESPAQYCSAVPLTKFIPYTEPVLTSCGTDRHKYCRSYLAVANPEGKDPTQEGDSDGAGFDTQTGEYLVEGLRVRDWLHYSPNHMWMDISPDGCVHIGIDSFLAGLMVQPDRLTFVTCGGICRPTLVFTIQGFDLPMVFPCRIRVTNPNLYMRTDPSRVLSDPYTFGWLFEGMEVAEENTGQSAAAKRTLRTGRSVASWMHHEVERLSRFLHSISHLADSQGVRLMADGGHRYKDLAGQLGREERIQLLDQFFSPWRSGGNSLEN